MDRRTFLGTLTAATVVGRRFAWAAETHHIDKVGVQLYTVRDMMKQDFDGTLAKVAQIGYREVEFAGFSLEQVGPKLFGKSPQEASATLKKNGLNSPSGHVPYEALEKKWPETLEAAHV